MAIPKRTSANKKPYINHQGFQNTPKAPRQKVAHVKQSEQQQDTEHDKNFPKRSINGRKKSIPPQKWQKKYSKPVTMARSKVTKASSLSPAPTVFYQKEKNDDQKPDNLEVHSELLEDTTSAQVGEKSSTLSQQEIRKPVPDGHTTEKRLTESSAATQARTNYQVILANIAYKDQAGASLIQVPLLEEIWEVDWVQSIDVIWKKDWVEIQTDITINIQDIRQDFHKKIVWIKGDLELTAKGTSTETNKLAHETLYFPFTSTILHPTIAKRSMEPNSMSEQQPAALDERWIETGDWKAMLLSDPFNHFSSTSGEYHGLAAISGRVWWFRKQFIPLHMIHIKPDS
ncbi:hypothetical protein J31TS6_47820 [Brevibacillus reuszeri]|uniref:hypothetical protein n=1 Tax=Brevibacillus reuszeri TaxID=54915 RepID=UPI001B22A9D2|nr:hypothetical protein [Brevibacillus reuszeri]GIO08754.1 hypothetical protein J31TS6_47820 [Brevibacillus reuszeri]